MRRKYLFDPFSLDPPVPIPFSRSRQFYNPAFRTKIRLISIPFCSSGRLHQHPHPSRTNICTPLPSLFVRQHMLSRVPQGCPAPRLGAFASWPGPSRRSPPRAARRWFRVSTRVGTGATVDTHAVSMSIRGGETQRSAFETKKKLRPLRNGYGMRW